MKTLLRTSVIVLLSFSLLSNCKAQDKQEPSVFDIVPDRFLLAILTPKVGELEPKLRKLSKQAYPDQLDLTSGVIKDFYENAGFDLSVSKFNRVLDRSRGGGLFLTNWSLIRYAYCQLRTQKNFQNTFKSIPLS